eukprot:45784-Chlamydomonas_euryale.AAC.1
MTPRRSSANLKSANLPLFRQSGRRAARGARGGGRARRERHARELHARMEVQPLGAQGRARQVWTGCAWLEGVPV